MPHPPRSTIPFMSIPYISTQKVLEWRSKNSLNLSRIQNRNKRHLRIGIPQYRIIAVEESNAGTYNHLRSSQIGRELAEMLHAERGWKLLVNIGEADLLTCLAARRLKGGFCVFCSAYRVQRKGLVCVFLFPFFFQFRLRRPTPTRIGFASLLPPFFFPVFTLNSQLTTR
jgi:hypothetical protein